MGSKQVFPRHSVWGRSGHLSLPAPSWLPGSLDSSRYAFQDLSQGKFAPNLLGKKRCGCWTQRPHSHPRQFTIARRVQLDSNPGTSLAVTGKTRSPKALSEKVPATVASIINTMGQMSCNSFLIPLGEVDVMAGTCE